MLANWLINYRGGFIRRGLSGEIILRTSNIFNIHADTTVYFLSLLVYVFFISFFIIQFWRKQYPFFILALPFFLGETIYIDPCMFIRQDSALILIFILMLSVLKKNNLRKIIRFVLVNLLFIFGILLHEVLFFFAFPIVVVTIWHKNKSLVKTCLFLCPSLIVFTGLFILSKYANIETMIRLTPEITRIDNVLHISMSLSEQFNYFFAGKKPPVSAIVFHITYILGVISLVYYVCINFWQIKIDMTSCPKINTAFLSQILMLQLLSVFPLFCIAIDWGRWIFLWVTSSFAYFLIQEENPFENTLLSKIDPSKSTLIKHLNQYPQVIFLCAICINCQICLPFNFDFWSNTPLFQVIDFLICGTNYYLTVFVNIFYH